MFHFFRVLKNFIHKRGISRFCVEDFLFLTTEKFLSGTLLCFRNFLVWKKFRDKKVGVSFYRGNFFISRRRKASWANTSVFENVSSRERIMDKKGVLRYSVGNFLSQIAEKHRGRTLLCFRNVLESKLFWIIAVSRFCSSFLSHSTETFRRGPLCLRNVPVSKSFGE